MKKFFVIMINIISIAMFIGFIPLFIIWLIFASQGYGNSYIFLFVWVPLIIVSIPLFLLTYKQTIKAIKEGYKLSKESIIIKAKHGNVYINTNNNSFKFKKFEVKIQDITEFQLVNNQTVVEKSGVGESIVGGMLFGGTGAIAGAMVGKKQKIKVNYKVFVKTNDIKHAGVVISLKLDNAYNLFETLKLITTKK